MKFKNPSLVLLKFLNEQMHTRTDTWAHTRTHTRMDKAKPICSPLFRKAWGIMRLLEALILAASLYKDIKPVVNQILSCINGPELHLLRFLTFFNRTEVYFALHIKLCWLV